MVSVQFTKVKLSSELFIHVKMFGGTLWRANEINTVPEDERKVIFRKLSLGKFFEPYLISFSKKKALENVHFFFGTTIIR